MPLSELYPYKHTYIHIGTITPVVHKRGRQSNARHLILSLHFTHIIYIHTTFRTLSKYIILVIVFINMYVCDFMNDTELLSYQSYFMSGIT